MGIEGICVLEGSVKGTIKITQEADGKPCNISGTVTGLSEGKHGFHIHQFGDYSSGCASTGGHFNPAGKNHGGPADEERHAGDLGNIIANAEGVAQVEIVDAQVTLTGVNSVVGRAIVVHAGEDDLGKGGFEDSLKTGHAGGRLSCGVIGITKAS